MIATDQTMTLRVEDSRCQGQADSEKRNHRARQSTSFAHGLAITLNRANLKLVKPASSAVVSDCHCTSSAGPASLYSLPCAIAGNNAETRRCVKPFASLDSQARLMTPREMVCISCSPLRASIPGFATALNNEHRLETRYDKVEI